MWARNKRQLFKDTSVVARHSQNKGEGLVCYKKLNIFLAVRGQCTSGQDFSLKFSMLWPVKIFRSKKSKKYFLLGIVNDIPKVTLNLQ